MARDSFNEQKNKNVYSTQKKKKKKDEKTVVKKPQSSSVSNNKMQRQTDTGTGKPSAKPVYKNNKAKTEQKKQTVSSSTRPAGTQNKAKQMMMQRQTDTATGSNTHTTAAQRQKMGQPTQQDLSNAQAKRRNALNKVDTAARNLGEREKTWERSNLSARNAELKAKRDAKREQDLTDAQAQKSGIETESLKQKQQQRHDEMQKTAAGRIAGNFGERVVSREKRILAETGTALADMGDVLNQGKINPNSRLAQDMGDLLPDREKTRETSKRAFKSLSELRDKEEQKLSKLTENAKGFEKTYYGAEESGQGMLSDFIMSKATGGMWEIPLALRTYGSQRGKAEAEGATTTEDRLNAAKDSVIEVVSEKIGGVFGAANLAPGKKFLTPLAERIEGNIAKKLEGKVSRDVLSAAGRWGRNIGEEYLEEVVANPAENLGENLIFRNRVQAEREAENDAYFADLGNSIQQKFAEHPEDVERYIAEMNSPDTRDEFIQNFKEGGMNDEQASKVADKMVDFMEAAARNDTETMKAIKASLDEDLVGNVTKKVWDWNEQLETLASTALLMGVSGAPGAVSTYQQGMAIKNAPNGKAAMESALQKVASFDTKNSAKAQSLLDSMQNGYEPTATQAYDIMVDESKVMAEMREREYTGDQVKARGMQRERLMIEPAVKNPDGTYSITGQKTAEKYYNDYYSTLEYADAYNQYRYRDEDKIDEDTVKSVATAVASYKAGTLVVQETADISAEHPEARALFEEMTGEDLSQYDVYKDGKLDIAASNVNMQKGLLANAANNFIQSARVEQAYWNDTERGQMEDYLASKVGGSGDVAVHDALQKVDPRDRSAFMLMGSLANTVYNHAKTSDASWEDIRRTYKRTYSSVDINALEDVYKAAKEDKAEEETPYLNYEVKVGEAMDAIANGDATPIIKGKFVNTTPYNEQTGKGRNLTSSERIVLESLAKGYNANYTMIDAQDERLSYTDENGDVLYNKAAVDLATGEVLIANNVDMDTAIHEATHIGARLASKPYRDMADYIFDKAFKYDPIKTQRILDAYRRTYADQNLSDAKLKEEVVSDLVAAFENDPRFVRDISQENPSLARKILNAIEDILRSLRNILATGRIQDPAIQNTFLAEIGAYEDARRMWLRMYREAQRNNAALGIAEWQDNVIRDSKVANARHTNVEQAEKERELFFRDSEGNGITERQAQMIHDIGPDIRFSRPTFLNDLAKGEYFAGLNNGTGGFAGLKEIASGKDILIRTMQKNGFTEKQSDAVVGFLTHMADYLDSDELQMRYSFIGWQDLTNAEITVRRDKDDSIVGVAVSAMVANGEYPVNFDMTTICNKREGVMEVIQELTRKYDADTGRTILNSIKLTDEKMWNINKALKAEGIDTACLGCFVEARRYYTNRFIDKIDDVWNSAVREARRKLGLPEEEYFNFAKGKKISGEDYNKISDLWTAYDESTEAKRSPAQRIKILMDEIVRNKEVDSPYLKLISAEDILTPEGIDGFKKISTKDRDMVKMIKSIYGTSAPKEILAFTPYNSEIALLPEKIKGKDAGAYLRSIGGTRVQSFSDFKMAHMFDHMQMVADEAARGFVNHGYSKVIAYPRLFGLTGRKINMSVMFDVLPASEWQSVLGCSEEAATEVAKKYQGLRFVKEKPEKNPDNRPYIETEIEGVHGYLTYLVSDADYVNSVFDELYQQYLAEGMDEDTARREANKAKPFEQSINYREAVALENQDGYKENVGIIAVAYGDEHLKILLDDPNVRYIIPYHRSGLPVFIAQKTALDIARDYTDSQNTRKAKRGMWFDKDGTKFNLKARYKNFKAEYEQEEHPDGSFPAIEFFKEISQLTFDNPVLTEEEINEKLNEYIQTLPEDISEEDKKERIKKQRAKLKKKDTSLPGTGSFDVYKDLDKVSDIREISNAYLEHCINKNQVPIFYDFAAHPNYYKMLFDFAVTDAEGNIYPQRSVRNVYPGLDIDAKVAAGEEITDADYEEFYKAIEEGLKTENAKNELRSNRLGKVLDEDLLSREGENSIIADTNVQHIVNGTPDYTNPKGSDVANSRDVSLDDDYIAAVNSGNMDEAQRLVDEAAKMAGYNTPKLYHGTPSFGFTEFDLSKGEMIIFATNSRLTAETYSGETERNKLSDKSNIDVDSLSGDALLNEASKYRGKYSDYQLMTPAEQERMLDESREEARLFAQDAANFIEEHKDSFDEEKLAIANRIVDSINRISNAWAEDMVDAAWNDFEDAMWDLKWMDESIQLELSQALQNGGSLQYWKNKISDMMYSGDIYRNKSYENEYIFDNQLALELEADLGKGIYGLYANPGRQLVIESNGSNWNQIVPPDELNLYGPQRTRSIAEAAKAKGYDSVLFKELRDNGGATAYNGDSDVYMFFNPNQVKSADPVTYREDGSVIPLSERFDPSNNDIRYSRPTIDAEGNILTDGQMEYFKNSQARDSQGRLVPVYHTTNKGGFTIFDPMKSDDHRSLFFSDDWDVSQTYGEYASSRFYYFDIDNIDDVKKYLDVYSPDRYFVTEEQFDQAGGWGADFLDFENITNGKQSDFNKYLENPDGYIAIVGVPDYTEGHNSYADRWITADSPDDLVKELRNSMLRGEGDIGTSHGYYACYLNLENPMIIDAQGQYWNSISIGELPIEEGAYFDVQRGLNGFNIILNGWDVVEAGKDWFEIGKAINEFFGFDEFAQEGLTVANEILSHFNRSSNDMHFGEDELLELFMDAGVLETHDTRGWAEIAQAEGYDGVIFRNVVDLGDKSDFDGVNEESTVYVAFSSNQVKDINNQNPTENPDIRYSRADLDEIMSELAYEDALDDSYKALKQYEAFVRNDVEDEYFKGKAYWAGLDEEALNEFLTALKEPEAVPSSDEVFEEDRVRRAKSKEDFFNNIYAKWNDRWTTEGEVLDIEKHEKGELSVKTKVRELVKAVMANSDTDAQYREALIKRTLIDMRTAFQLMKQDHTELASYLLYQSALNMIDGVEFIKDDTAFKEYKEIRDFLREYRINVPDKLWEDEKFQDFRKEYFARLRIGKGESNIEDVYKDCQDRWPHLFNEAEREKADNLGDSPEDLLIHIGYVVDSNVTPWMEAYSSEEAVGLAYDTADALYDIMVGGPELVSLADEYKNRFDEKTKALKQRHYEALLRERKAKEEGIQKEREKFRAYKEQQKEKKNHSKHFTSINKSYDELKKRLLTNTADKHIPEQYKRELARLLSAFDLQTVGSKKREAKTGHVAQKTIKMGAIRTALKMIEDKSDMFRLNDAITDIMEDLLSIDGKVIDELSITELTQVDKLLKSLLHEFNNYEKVRIGKKKEYVSGIAEAQITSALDHAKIFGPGNDYRGVRGWLDQIMNMDEMTPAYMFKMIDPEGKGLGLMWKEIKRSQDKYIRNTAQISEWMNEIVGKYHNKGKLNGKYGAETLEKWRSTNYTQTIELTNGTVELTPAQMMSLYCLSKRNQAYRHMVGAGIVVAPVSFQAKIMSDVKKKINRSLPVILTDADIDKIKKHLTKEQVDVADKLQQLMSTKMADLGNEASMDVIGIKLFNESDYFPIKSDKAALERDLSNEQFENAIRNFGFTKAVQPGARNAIMIEDIFDVVTEHCNNMNLYNAYSKTLNDFMKVFNKHSIQEDGADYSVRQALAHAYSQKATTFIMEFIRDINGNVSKGRTTGIETAMNDMLGKAKQASVFANLRVLAQQPTAITRAFAVISPKYLKGVNLGDALVGMVPTVTTEAMKEMFEHCPIALWKSWGYYDINMGKSIEDIIMNDGNFLEDLATSAYGKADNITWTAIWQMVKAETKDLHKELEEGSDEYWEHCNERMSEIVDLTQVVDSPLHRSHAMRAKDILHKTTTSFMAEPTLTFNMIRDGLRRAREAWKQGKRGEAAKIFGWTGFVAALQAATVSAAAAVVDALRGKNAGGDDDDEGKSLWLINFLNNLKEEAKIWNKVYYVKDLASIAEGWDNANLALQGWKSFIDGFKQLDKKLFEGSKTPWWKIYYNLLGGIGYFTGVPVKTLMKDGRAIFELLGGELPESLVGEEKTDSIVSEESPLQAMRIFKTGEQSSGTPTTVAMVSAADKWYDYENNPINVRDGSPLDKLLNTFGVNLTAAEKADISEDQKQKKISRKAKEINSKYDNLTGEERSKKVWSAVTSYYKSDIEGGKSFSEMVAEGRYEDIHKMKMMYQAAGGDREYFEERVLAESKSALKKSISYDQTQEQIDAQEHIKEYMLYHGMSEDEISEIAYKSVTARDLKVAFRINDKALMLESLEPLVNAGLTYDDMVRLWDNRNRVDLVKYKKDGRYKDKLKSTGTFIWPTQGTITSHFGYRNAPTRGASSNHPAIDIGAPKGTPVAAADGGVVIYAGSNGGYGNSVGIKHDNGWVTYYNHLSGWNVQVGDTVAQGQQIAAVGSTGVSTGPHLDFKVLDTNNKPVDPEKYLNGKYF